ncbi:hypothetical protein [Desulfococcus sp.]|uniref:hypothetical protein n=1 Tax=Desulfococcus sp. TaxID=2025834 RepID=UPI00359488D6
MTHEDAGHYAAKHPKGAAPDARIAEALKTKVKDGKVSCAAAHGIAEELNVLPKEVGRNMDLMELRIVKCQMGLFGYSPEKKIVTPAKIVSAELQAAISGEVENGRLACRAAWDMADRFGISRLEIAAACEALSIKVSPCQIGAF